MRQGKNHGIHFQKDLVQQAVDHAENGREAVNMFRSAPDGTHDAILTDVSMPVMDAGAV